MDQPVVSIICISHNHKLFIHEAVQSVLAQMYRNIELILIDDKSTDGTREFIRSIIAGHPEIKFKLLESHSGICKAFNEGLKLSSGEFIIDFSADDILLPERVEQGLKTFKSKDESFGINFSNASYVDVAGKFVKNHFEINSAGKSRFRIAEGYLYPLLLARYYICTPAMMTRKKVFEDLGGYDESLDYEDFDFWVRTSKQYKYCYTDAVLVKKRNVKGSFSSSQYERGGLIPASTLAVCLKAEKINENEEDRKALLKRVTYEFRKSLFSGNKSTAKGFLDIIKRNCRSKLIFLQYLFLYKIMV